MVSARSWMVATALVGLLAGAAAEAGAQSGYVGVKGGMGFWDVSSDPASGGDTFESEGVSGFTGGIVAGLRLSPRFSLSAEVLFTQKGFKVVDDDGGGGEIEIDVFEIPVLANLHLGSETARFSPRLFGGGWVSFESACELEVSEVELACDDAPDGTPRKKTDYGLALGAALDVYDVGPTTLFLDARYLLGLNNIDDSPTTDNLNVKTRGFAFSAGVALPLG